jgi:hypothetical protein
MDLIISYLKRIIMDSHLFNGHKMGLKIKWINNNSINSPLMSIDMDWKLVGTIHWINEANNYIQYWCFLSSHSASLQICYCVSKLAKLVYLQATMHRGWRPFLLPETETLRLALHAAPLGNSWIVTWGWVTTLKNGQCNETYVAVENPFFSDGCPWFSPRIWEFSFDPYPFQPLDGTATAGA